MYSFKKTVKISSFVVLFAASASRAQYKPNIQIGTILSTSMKKSNVGRSPLIVNGGNATFLNEWTIFLGTALNENISVYAEVQTVNGIKFVNYGLSAIYKSTKNPWFNFEVGKFLVPFGRFLERRWASENPFIDFPLIYEYRTGLSAFDLPQNDSELLRVRGKGNAFQYHDENIIFQKQQRPGLASGHIPVAGAGLRILSREVYLTGFQLFGVGRVFKYHFGVTNGALSNPSDINNSNGIQVHGRVSVTPTTGLEIGSSASSGVYLDKKSVQPQLDVTDRDAEEFRQNAFGLDMSYAFGHFMFFSEFMFNRWESPFVQNNLDAVAFYVEGKYRWLTRFYSATRFSLINFSTIPDPEDIDNDGNLSESWDYDIYQLELVSGYYINRNALAKILLQLNKSLDVPTGDPDDNLFALQLVVFF